MTSPYSNPWLNEYFDRFRVGTDGWSSDRPLQVCFLVGSLDISGGTYVILEHAMYLQKQGVLVTVVPMLDDVKSHWHPALEKVKIASFEDVANVVFDVAIATWWRTVFELPKLRFRHAVYFVQSIESRFAALRTDPLDSQLAELTYRMGIPTITITKWMQMYLSLEHRLPSFLVNNGIAKSRYSEVGPIMADRPKDSTRFLIEGPVGVPMKGVEEAIDACKDAGVEDVWLMTSSDVKEFPGVSRVFSRVPVSETGMVYRSADVLLKLSQVEGMYGPPLEMFHCGGTVITWNVTGSEEYVEDGVNGLVCDMGDRAQLVRAIRRLKSDREVLQQLKQGASTTARRWPDWEDSSHSFLAYVLGIASATPIDGEELALRISGARPLLQTQKALAAEQRK